MEKRGGAGPQIALTVIEHCSNLVLVYVWLPKHGIDFEIFAAAFNLLSEQHNI